MLTGSELGAAIEAARIKKNVPKNALAKVFGISAPSVNGWVSTGRIDKSKLIEVIRYFSDVVGPDHWGLTADDASLLQITTTDRRPLQDWEKQECASLKEEFLAFNRSQPNGKKLTQEEAAHALGMSQGTFSSHLNGHRALNKEMAATLAKMLGIPVSRFSQRLADEIQAMSEPAGIDDQPAETASAADLILDMLAKRGKSLSDEARRKISEAAASPSGISSPATNVITADFSRPGPVGDEIRIAHYDVRAAMGDGQMVPDYPEIMQDIVVSQKHLAELGVSYKDAAHLKMLTGWGQSMAPTIQDLDPMIADASIREFQGDGIYAFSWQGHFYVKRLQVIDAEHFDMISDNPNHKDREIRIDETYIQARILLVWNARKV